MKKLLPSTQRGQALILIALAAIGLFAVGGLAIDGSAKFSDRRHAQNAADTAAVTGALAKLQNDPQWDLTALDRALDNGYDDNHVSNEVQVHNPPISGIYADCSDIHFDCHDYVQVIIDSNVNTFFAQIIGINQTHNHVEAVATTISSNSSFNFGGNAIVALSPEGCALKAGGTTDVTVNGGGMFSNSADSCAFQKTTCSGSIEVNDSHGNEGTITMVGGYNINTSCWDPTKANLNPSGAKQQLFPPPYNEIAEPAECSTNGTKTNDNTAGTTTLTPGYFDSIPPSGGGPTKHTFYLTPGVYCVGSTFSTSGLDTVTVLPPATFGDANGVFIYIKPGGSFTMNSSTDIHLWAPTSGSYANYLFYVAPDYSLTTPPTCRINGSSTSQFMGMIYAPYCNLILNGGSGMTLQSQLVGYTVDLTGASGVILNYDSNTSPVWVIPQQVGLTQ